MAGVFISTATSHDEAARAANVAVLPIGSFEQHGGHLPLATDTLIAAAIAKRVSSDYDLLLLPPITIGCSHEHADFTGTVSISSVTLYAIVTDVAASLGRAGMTKLVLINGHGGNYVLSNVAQESNVGEHSTVLFPRSEDWTDARRAAGLITSNHEDMHGGEAETSILLATAPETVRSSYHAADFTADERRNLLTVGVRAYSASGVIGRPSLATAEKGRRLLDAFSVQFKPHLALLR
ncbi:MAG: creatininase family protein [Actinobacteria bacterium]|nr:creatininase family protein [Actinomycetota bacterium]